MERELVPALLVFAAAASASLSAQDLIFADGFETGSMSGWTETVGGAPGAVVITKTAKNAALGPGQHPHPGVTFEVRLDSVLIASTATDWSGQACVDGLTAGEAYSVTEVVPVGYAAASPNPQPVLVSGGATCSSGSPDALGFINAPLSALQINFFSLAGPGVTKAASVQCAGPSIPDPVEGGPLEHGQSTTFTNLIEGTYTCTIVVDP